MAGVEAQHVSPWRTLASAIAFVILTLSQSATAAEPVVDASVWPALATVHELTARFTQTQQLSVLRTPLASEGSLKFVRPASVEWAVESPARSSFVLNGHLATMAYPDLGMSEQVDLAQVPDANRLATSLLVWMTADAASVARDFDVVYGPGSATLAPKDPTLRGLVASIELSLVSQPWRVSGVVINQPNGDRVTLRFTSLVLDGVPVTTP